VTDERSLENRSVRPRRLPATGGALRPVPGLGSPILAGSARPSGTGSTACGPSRHSRSRELFIPLAASIAANAGAPSTFRGRKFQPETSHPAQPSIRMGFQTIWQPGPDNSALERVRRTQIATRWAVDLDPAVMRPSCCAWRRRRRGIQLLAQKYHRAIIHFFSGWCATRHAEELAQECFCASTLQGSYRAEAKFTTWLTG